MAKRNTLKEIETLKRSLEKQFPGKKFHVDHIVGESAVHPGAIETQGLTVSRWEQGQPIVAWEKWELTELATCPGCGKEWKNVAIGEDVSFCYDCNQGSVFSSVSSRPSYGDWEGSSRDCEEAGDFFG